MKAPGPIFTLRLSPEPGTEPIPALRQLLKALLRRYRLRCLSITEERPE